MQEGVGLSAEELELVLLRYPEAFKRNCPDVEVRAAALQRDRAKAPQMSLPKSTQHNHVHAMPATHACHTSIWAS